MIFNKRSNNHYSIVNIVTPIIDEYVSSEDEDTSIMHILKINDEIVTCYNSESTIICCDRLGDVTYNKRTQDVKIATKCSRRRRGRLTGMHVSHDIAMKALEMMKKVVDL